MKITKRQLKRIIQEERVKLTEYGGRPYDPMEYPEGMNTRGYNPITGDIPQGYTEEDMYYDDYVSWAKKNGHVTPASSSVLATYVVDSGLDEPTWLSIASDVGIDALDVRMDITRQQAEQSVTMGESKMKITKRQLRRIIREAMAPNIPDVVGAVTGVYGEKNRHLADRLNKVWDVVRADTLEALGGQATWEEIADEVLASGYSIDPGMVEEINLLPFPQQQALFQKAFGSGSRY